MRRAVCLYAIPWFKNFRPQIIEEYANALIKAAKNYRGLLDGDKGNPPDIGGWSTFFKYKLYCRFVSSARGDIYLYNT